MEKNLYDIISRFGVQRHDQKELREKLIQEVSYLILNDFNLLVQILYRVDVDEEKLRALLKNNESDAAVVIADMLIARQMEKVRLRNTNENATKI